MKRSEASRYEACDDAETIIDGVLSQVADECSGQDGEVRVTECIVEPIDARDCGIEVGFRLERIPVPYHDHAHQMRAIADALEEVAKCIRRAVQ